MSQTILEEKINRKATLLVDLAKLEVERKAKQDEVDQLTIEIHQEIDLLKVV